MVSARSGPLVQESINSAANVFSLLKSLNNSYYQDAITRAKKITKSLKPELLPPEDQEDFETDLGKAAVKKFLDRQEEHFKTEEKKKEKRKEEGKIPVGDIAKKAVYAFVSFVEYVEPILDVVVPSTPEYAIPYACLKLIFKASVPTLHSSLRILLNVCSPYQNTKI
jgi:hypothetical protein